jgi:hypothetical protein
VAIKKLVLYGLQGRTSFGDIVVELNNGKISKKMGTGTDRPRQGDLLFNKNTCSIILEQTGGHSISGMKTEFRGEFLSS